jgi:hypothetical protein
MIPGAVPGAWGPIGGLSLDRAPDVSGDRYVGWHAGLAAVSPDGTALWRFLYGRSTSRRSVTLERVDARLSFPFPVLSWVSVHTGAGTGLAWIDNRASEAGGAGGRHRIWMSEAFAGLLIDPVRLLDYTGLFGGKDLRLRRGTLVRATGSRFILGAEAGWRAAARSLAGPEARAWLQITL